MGLENLLLISRANKIAAPGLLERLRQRYVLAAATPIRARSRRGLHLISSFGAKSGWSDADKSSKDIREVALICKAGLEADFVQAQHRLS